jgi:septation ring formation regulator EzrA
MADTTEIEKKSLEAHVELCAERYKLLELKLDSLEEKIGKVADSMSVLHNMMEKSTQKRTDQLLSWGIGIIGVLLATVGWLATHYIQTL